MSDIAIKAENISKLYRLGEFSTGTLSHDINRWFAKVRGKEDPFAQIGETNDRTAKGKSDFVWSLKDINFEIRQGDSIGVIGRNGAGKSTLLKILSRVTAPTTGTIKVKGRIASLLEVGTGFHPELTGRENIYLNGAILGMRKKEITRKFDSIVDFAGVERYIDTPVKRYSSGMYVRLAFAVAAYLESEILIVDEVLAVGDDEFQKKCLGKMDEVSKKEGKTVLFVSHNLESIRKCCQSGILLNYGEVKSAGSVSSVINDYLGLKMVTKKSLELAEHLPAYVTNVELLDMEDNMLNEVLVGQKWKVRVHYVINEPMNDFVCGIGMSNIQEVPLRTSWAKPQKMPPGKYVTEFIETSIDFSTGTYMLNVGLSKGAMNFQFLSSVLTFDITSLRTAVDESVIRTESNFGIIVNPMKVLTFEEPKPVLK
jgi:ABC-type polysaccharide/polyol phosphate transport system ATPase subunit